MTRAILLFAFLSAASAWAQQDFSFRAEYLHVLFNRPTGHISLTFPQSRPPGEHISGRIIVAPDGATEDERAENLRKLEALRFWWAEQTTPVKDGVVKWVSPGNINNLWRYVCLLDPGADWAHAGRDDCHHLVGNPFFGRFFGPPAGNAATYIPELNRLDYIRIVGSFNGDLSSTHVEMDGRPVIPLAESERDVLLEAPASPGLHRISVRDKSGFTTTEDVRYYEIKATPEELLKTGKTSVRFTLAGLEKLNNRSIILALQPPKLDKAAVTIERPSGANVRAVQSRFWKSNQTKLRIDPDFVPPNGVYAFQLLLAVNDSSGQSGRSIPLPGALSFQLGYVQAGEATIRVVSRGIDQWSKENEISVEPSAQEEILNEFKKLNVPVFEGFTRYEEQFPGYDSYLRTFTRAYLYEMKSRRSLVVEEKEHTLKFLARPPFSFRMIRLPDVIAFSVDSFMTLWAKMMSEKAVVEIQSSPSNQEWFVSLDGVVKPSDPRTDLDLWIPIPPKVSKTVLVSVRGGTRECKTTIKLDCPGNHGTLTCDGNTGIFQDESTNTCASDRGGVKMGGN